MILYRCKKCKVEKEVGTWEHPEGWTDEGCGIGWYCETCSLNRNKTMQEIGMENEVHPCDSCTKKYPCCNNANLIFGTGKNADNIAACSNYDPTALRKNDPEEIITPEEKLCQIVDSLFMAVENANESAWKNGITGPFSCSDEGDVMAQKMFKELREEYAILKTELAFQILEKKNKGKEIVGRAGNPCMGYILYFDDGSCGSIPGLGYPT